MNLHKNIVQNHHNSNYFTNGKAPLNGAGETGSHVESTAVGIKYAGINHCGVLVKDRDASVDFFTNVFGFIDDSHLRPTTLPYPGAFLRCGINQIHLMQLPKPEIVRGEE